MNRSGSFVLPYLGYAHVTLSPYVRLRIKSRLSVRSLDDPADVLVDKERNNADYQSFKHIKRCNRKKHQAVYGSDGRIYLGAHGYDRFDRHAVKLAESGKQIEGIEKRTDYRDHYGADNA